MKHNKFCANCVHKKVCDIFFKIQYKRILIEEPLLFKNWACNMFEKKN